MLAHVQAAFATKPSAAPPHAVITRRIGCVAVVKSVPWACLAATTAADTTVRSAAPTCELVDGITAATPVQERHPRHGMLLLQTAPEVLSTDLPLMAAVL
jgi:hypothetical protein